MDGAGRVLGWGVDRVELEWVDPGCVHNFVPGIWRNSDGYAISKFLFCLAGSANFGYARALFYANELRCMWVLFDWYKFAGLEAHQHQLLMFVSIYDFPIVGILDCFIFQVDQERHDDAKYICSYKKLYELI